MLANPMFLLVSTHLPCSGPCSPRNPLRLITSTLIGHSLLLSFWVHSATISVFQMTCSSRSPLGSTAYLKTMLAISHIRAGIKTEILSSHEIISGAFFANYSKGNRAWSPFQDRITLGLTCLTHRTHSRGQNKIVLCNGRSRDVNNIPHCSHWR